MEQPGDVTCLGAPGSKPTGKCGSCGKTLTGRQTRFCSRACRWGWQRNHMWSKAKKFFLDQHAWFECAHCGWWFQRPDVQVNHITPALGAHSKASCVHHLDNLEILCKPCHQKVTNKQRKERSSGNGR